MVIGMVKHLVALAFVLTYKPCLHMWVHGQWSKYYRSDMSLLFLCAVFRLAFAEIEVLLPPPRMILSSTTAALAYLANKHISTFCSHLLINPLLPARFI